MIFGEREVQRDEPVRMRRAAAYFWQFARERLNVCGVESGFWLRRPFFFT